MNSPFSTVFRNRMRFFGILLLSFLLLGASAVTAQSDSVIVTNTSEKTVTLYLFESTGCMHCAKAEETIHELMVKYPSIQLVDMEVSGNETNRLLFESVSRNYGIEIPGVPLLLVGNHVLLGDVQIKNDLETTILSELQNKTSSEPSKPSGLSENSPGAIGATSALTVPLVIAAAFVDGLNPCALAVLVFLIVTILAVGDRRKALACGFTYTLAIFILYFLAGIGIFAGIRSSGLTKEIYIIAAAIAIIAGILSFRDAFAAGKSPLLRIPAFAGGVIKNYAETASVPASFVLGLIVGLFEMPCTGAIYFSVLNLLGSSMSFSEGLLYLLLYNLIFILPLIVVIIAVFYGLPAKDAEGWRARNMRKLRLVSGIFLLATGVIMLVFLR